jgi:hypothetical protein
MNGLIQLGNSFNAILNFIYPKSTIAPMPLSCNFIPVYTIHPCFFHKILFKMTKLPSPHLQPLAEFKAEHVAAVLVAMSDRHKIFFRALAQVLHLTCLLAHLIAHYLYRIACRCVLVPPSTSTTKRDSNQRNRGSAQHADRGSIKRGAGEVPSSDSHLDRHEAHCVVVGHKPADAIETDGVPQAGRARQERNHLDGQHVHLLPSVEPHARPLNMLSSKAP